jgi:predicted PurR-regulated permease PerM
MNQEPLLSPIPRWQSSTKLVALVGIILAACALVYLLRGLIIPILMSMVVAYILIPAVDLFHLRLRLPRTAAIGVVYLLLVALVIAIPAGTVPGFVNQGVGFVNAIPDYLQSALDLISEPVIVVGQEVNLRELMPLEEAILYMVDYVPTVGVRSVNIFGSLASATISTVGWVIVVLFVSFYMVKDHQKLFDGVVKWVPELYQPEMYALAHELSLTWNAFLRGQLILFAIMGTTVFVLATIIGLPHALLLGFIAGLVEFVPQIGAILAMIPAVLIAFVQYDQSWLGVMMGPFWFALLIMVGYILLQQFENYVLVPRVMGNSLNLHPMVVFVAALGGAGLAGILGILLAAPMVASGRVVFRYVYCKLLDIPPFPDKIQVEQVTPTAELETDTAVQIGPTELKHG